MKLKYDHCEKCKGTENLRVKATRTLKDGTLKKYYYCKDCNSLRHRLFRQTERGKEVYREIMRKQYKKYKEKILARQSLAWARRRKHNPLIKPEKCEMCGEIKSLDGHHEDYSKPLEVKWICRQCHFNV